MEEKSELRATVHMSCLPSGYYEPEQDMVAVLCCIFVFHWAGVVVIYFHI